MMTGFLLPVAAAPVEDLRQSLVLNREWKFQLGDESGASAIAFDDARWQSANLPHSFSIPYFAATDKFYVGYGWYRKYFEVPGAWLGKRIHLEFDGVFQVAEVFVNGNRVGEHRGGYTGFEFDITGEINAGTNVLAVRVNNLWDPQLAPRAGEHAFSGGIYRNVRLVIKAPLHVDWYGTFVTMPQVSAESGIANVKTLVVNKSSEEKAATIRTIILDANRTAVAQMESSKTIAPDCTAAFNQTSPSISNPQLWSPEQPYLYSVRTIVLDNGVPVDEYSSPLGFRWFNFTADKGFFLNGSQRYLKGANAHQDHAGWGDAVTDSGLRRDVQMLKQTGMDFVRGSHYPHAPAFTKACDDLSLLFWSENVFWGIGGFKSDGYWDSSAYPTNAADEAGFEGSVKQQLREMIRIHRNHPSIVAWSMSNEPFFSAEEVMPKVRKFLTELVSYCRELDPTRPVAVGGCQRGDIDRIGDIAGYNGDGARLPEFQRPGVASLVSEYGSTIADRPGKYEPGWGELARTPGAGEMLVGSWRMPWRSGEAIWCGFDHGSIAGRNFGAMGIVDYFRLPKRAWYWYRNEYAKIPPPKWPVEGVPAALRLTADKTLLRAVDGTDDVQLIVTIFDKEGRPLNNCPPVTLAVESGPGEFPTGPDITFTGGSDIAIRDGMAAISFRSYHAGQTVIRATSPGLQDARIVIQALGEPAFIPGKTLTATPRPYVPFTVAGQAPMAFSVGRSNPTRASSEARGHTGRLANDGNPATYWEAEHGDTNAWLQVDMEKILTVSKTKLTFPCEGNWRYKIEVSSSGESGRESWKLVADQTRTSSTAKERTDIVQAPSSRGRFLRVTVTSAPTDRNPGLAELEVIGTGTLATR